MNTNRDLLKRLLHLYPVTTVRDKFNVSGSADEVVEEITGNKTAAAIKSFAIEHLLLTKQNVYLFTLNRTFRTNQIGTDFPYSIEGARTHQGETQYLLLPKITYAVYLSDPTDKQEITFVQPVLMRFSGTRMIIHFTKLKKDVKSYFPMDRQPKLASADNDEEQTLSDIIAYLSDYYTVAATDINAGVKHLWDIDDIDCNKIQQRNPHSVRVETMDEQMTFKEKYHQEYQKIILTPLGKSIWKYLKDDDYFCPTFTLDPTLGQIGFSRFPSDVNQVENVINKILANN
jgi:hypothetical protein